jgi:hypothetical protein
MEIVLAKEMKRIAEDMQLRDVKVNKILLVFFSIEISFFRHFRY